MMVLMGFLDVESSLKSDVSTANGEVVADRQGQISQIFSTKKPAEKENRYARANEQLFTSMPLDFAFFVCLLRWRRFSPMESRR